MKEALSIAIITLIVSAATGCHTAKPVAENTRPCRPEDTKYLSCDACPDSIFQGTISPTTVEGLMAHRSASKSTLFIFVNAARELSSMAMPPYLYVATHVDTIAPELVLMDGYENLPSARRQLLDWGWTGAVHVLDQDHYGCYEGQGYARNCTLLHEFGIDETPGFCWSRFIAVLVGQDGTMLGYSNSKKLPWLMNQHAQ